MATQQDLANVDLDLAFIDAIATQANGTATNRLGVARKVLAQVIADLAAQDVGASAAAQINQRLNGVGNEASGARTLLERIYALPLALPQQGNVNSLAYLAGVGTAPADGATFSVVILSTNTGATSINAAGVQMNILNPGTASAMSAGQLPAGSIVALQRNNQFGAAFLVGVRSLAFPGVALTADLGNIEAALEALLGVQAALPGASVNNLNVGGAAPADGEFFEAFITANNTGPSNLTRGGITRDITDNPGTGAQIAANVLKAGTIRKFQYSAGGGKYVVTDSRPPSFAYTPPTPPPVGAQGSDLTTKPFGNLTNNGSSGTQVTPLAKSHLIVGSSNATDDYVADGFRPSQLIPAALNAAFAGENINWTADTKYDATANPHTYSYPQPGAPFTTASGQMQASTTFMAGGSAFVSFWYWMNDVRTIFYHDNGGVMSQLGAIPGLIDFARSKGAEPILMTGFHPDPRAHPGSAQAAKSLDPFFFSDGSAYPNGGSGRSMTFPVAKGSPVSPTADMVPAATQAGFTIVRDWTGGGKPRTGYRRLMHFNREVARIASEKGCVLWDFQYSTYKNCIETVADLAAGLETFYDSTGNGNPLHPKGPLYQLGIAPVINEWARYVADGRNDKRVFRGDGS